MTIFSPADNLTRRAANCSIFERALDALPDGVLLVNAARQVVYTNPAFKQLWHIPNHILAEQDDGRNLQFVMCQLADPEGFRLEVERLHATAETSHGQIALKDGRIISRRSLPFEEDGNFRARIWIFTDITEARNATIDELTQLANRRAFSREFPSFVMAPADGLMRAAAIIDVDHFKQYNDLYGHAEGDSTLRRIGAIIASHARHAGDLAFRIGGEEFLMTTRTRKTDEAAAIFEAVRVTVEAMKRPHSGNPGYGIVTVSIGFASFEGAAEGSIVFQRIDDALYRAKAGGRNRIVEAAL